jgi:uncharacterized delta-60 repeat protein
MVHVVGGALRHECPGGCRHAAAVVGFVSMLLVPVLGGDAVAGGSAGTLDRTFGDHGVVVSIAGFQPGTDGGVVVQDGGRIVIAGTDFSVAGLLPSGAPDSRFGRNAVAHADLTGWRSRGATDVALGPGGAIVVGGKICRTDGCSRERYALVRYTASGHRDPTFGDDGAEVFACSPRPFCSNDPGIAVQRDGKVVLSVWSGGFLIERRNANGTLDRSFGNDGLVTHREGECCPIEASSAVQDADGRIVAAGADEVLRLLPDGRADPTFGRSGTAKLPRGLLGAPAVAIGPLGGIVVVGTTADLPGPWAVIRFTPTGHIDRTFGGTGLTEVHLSCQDTPMDVAIEPDGRIVVVGETFNCAEFGKERAAIVRLTARGRLDPSFSGNGKVLWPGYSLATGVALDEVGSGERVVVSGVGHFTVARYLA